MALGISRKRLMKVFSMTSIISSMRRKYSRTLQFYCIYGGKYGNITCKDVKSPFECELKKNVLTGIKDIIDRMENEHALFA